MLGVPFRRLVHEQDYRKLTYQKIFTFVIVKKSFMKNKITFLQNYIIFVLVEFLYF